MKKLIIMRGLPGSGKSTRVATLIKDLPVGTYAVCSNDKFPGYYVNGVYTWTPEVSALASKWCWKEFDAALKSGVDTVIVDNTNLSKRKWKKFADAATLLGYTVHFEEMTPDESLLEMYAQRNVHKVDIKRIKQMFNSWEEVSDD